MKCCLSALLCLLALHLAAQKTYIQCGRLIDGISNTEQQAVTIIVQGNTIVGIEKGYTKGTSADREIDLKNKTVLPGLIDCHVHLESQFSKTSIIEGITRPDPLSRSTPASRMSRAVAFIAAGIWALV